MSPQPEREVRTIVVLGGGVVGLSAALAFARALPQVEVSVIALREDPAALAERFCTTLPAIGRFHAAIGVGEQDLVARGIAVHHLGTRFDDWSADEAPWVHAFGEYGVPEWPVVFHDLWARARKSSRAVAYHRYSAAAVLAEAGKFIHPREGQWPLSTFRYGLRLDPRSYRAFLDQLARSARVVFFEAQVTAVERRQDGGLSGVQLDDGRRVEADLFIDCSGARAVALSELEPGFESWADLFPCDGIEFRVTEGGVTPLDTVAASPEGWSWSQPFSHGTLVATASPAERQRQEREGEWVSIQYGRRPTPWKANVVAIGDAAVSVDPLYGANLHLAHGAILRALELLPGRDCHPVEVREYNRRTEQEVRRVRDFLAVHYLRSGRCEGEIWRRLAAAKPPESLAHTLDQFENRGRLPFYEEETFTRDSWTAVLLGMGVLPRGCDAVAGKFPFEESLAAMGRLAEQLSSWQDRLPPYPEYLDRMLAGASRSAAH